MKTPEATPRLSKLLKQQKPRPPGGQGFSLFLGFISSLAITLKPQLVTANIAELRHSELLLLLTAIALCLVHGTGFQFKTDSPGHWIVQPLTAWPLLALSWWKLWI